MNISEKTYHQLKTKIIANELVGAVSENELCQELNVSRTPLREAIFRLMTEGWIERCTPPSETKSSLALKLRIRIYFLRQTTNYMSKCSLIVIMKLSLKCCHLSTTAYGCCVRKK